jgi:hypothetical protein
VSIDLHRYNGRCMADPPRDCQGIDAAGNQGRNVAMPKTVERDARQFPGQHEPAPIPAQIVGRNGVVVEAAEDEGIWLGLALPKAIRSSSRRRRCARRASTAIGGQGHHTASVLRLRGLEAQASLGLFQAALDLGRSGIEMTFPQLSARISPRRAPVLRANIAIGSSG